MEYHPNPQMNSLITKFLTTDFDTPGMRAGDWLIALASIGVGLWYAWTLWIVVGIVGLFLAWWRPMTRLQRFAGSLIRSVGRRGR